MERDTVGYAVVLAVLSIIALTCGFQPAYAGGYTDFVAGQLSTHDYGLYYKVNQDQFHIGVSVEDDGTNEWAVEHFVEYTINTMWFYVNKVNPSYNGVLKIAGFENYHGQIREVFYIEVPASQARMMSQVDFLEDGMQYYYNEPSYKEFYVTYPKSDYYSSSTTYSGTSVVLVDTYGDLYEPQDGAILVTTQADTADWNTPI